MFLSEKIYFEWSVKVCNINEMKYRKEWNVYEGSFDIVCVNWI